MGWLELQSSRPFNTLNVSLVTLLLKWEVSLNDFHSSQEHFFSPHGLDLPSASILGNAARTRWSLRLLSFLKPITGTFLKTGLRASSGVSRRCNSAKKNFNIFENWIVSRIKRYFVLFFAGIFSVYKGVSWEGKVLFSTAKPEMFGLGMAAKENFLAYST